MKNITNSIYNLIKENKIVFFSGFIILGFFIFFIILMLNNGTMAIELNKDFLYIDCSDVSNKSEEFECSLMLNSTTISTQGITANYEIPEEIEFVSFEPTNGWSSYVNDSDGFAIVNLNGVQNETEIGTIKFKMSSNVISNINYSIKITNITIGDGEDITISLDDVSDEIRIASDINTLDNITISDGTLNEIFNKDINEYTGIVNSDKIIIDVIKTDSNSIVSGDVGEVMLHYGTNIFNIVVTSESGKVNIYKITIFRKYDFSIDTYIYDKENNYIYTGRDTESSIILSNLNLPVELKGKIENNKLIISYLEEVLLKIDIVNFISNEYSILNNTIYIGNDLDYSDFINTISMNGVTFKIYNGNIEITSGIIDDNYKLVINYKNNVLEEFVFKKDYLTFDGSLEVDEVKYIINNVKSNTAINDIIDLIYTNGTINVIDKNNIFVEDYNRFVGTGFKFEIILPRQALMYTISVRGDINGDGLININDVIIMSKYLINNELNIDDVKLNAIDVNDNNVLDINDIIKTAKHIINDTEL